MTGTDEPEAAVTPITRAQFARTAADADGADGPAPAPAPAPAPIRRRRVPRWAFLPFIAMAIVHVAALAFGWDAGAAPTKLALMPLLALAVFVGARGLQATAAVSILLTAILFSWLGDGAGTFVPFLPTLPMMLAFFGIAHLAYMLLFWRHVGLRKVPLWAAAFVAWWVAMIVIIAPHAGDLVLAVAAYGIVLGGTAALATRCSPAVLIGGIFFLTSDTILAFRLFLPHSMPDWTSPLVMFTYCLGQGLIAAGVLATLRRRQARTDRS